MPKRARRVGASSRTESQRHGSPRILRGFRQFLRVTRDNQHDYNLHHAQVLVLMQPTNKNMDVLINHFCWILNTKMALSTILFRLGQSKGLVRTNNL